MRPSVALAHLAEMARVEVRPLPRRRCAAMLIAVAVAVALALGGLARVGRSSDGGHRTGVLPSGSPLRPDPAATATHGGAPSGASAEPARRLRGRGWSVPTGGRSWNGRRRRSGR